MLRFPRSAAAFAVLLTVAACNASDKAASTATAIPDVEIPELSLATLQEVTKELSLDAYEGRAPGTPGEEKTVAYLIKKYQEAGLKPGNNGSWTQDVPLVEITAKNATPLTFTMADQGGAPITLKAHIGYSDGNPGLGPNGTSVAPTGTYLDWLIGADIVPISGLTLSVAYVDTDISEAEASLIRPNFATLDGNSISDATVVFSVTASF